MSLSFREEAAIRLLIADPAHDRGFAVNEAQNLADAFCVKFGHEFPQNPTYYATTCARCGHKTPEPKR